ncbi:hypothetical protein MBAV_002464 [Candidatus Magnetobacterium bavaricum]|uniref:Uncharacterized protein n=1 Tax=Candidatus Magnetobacterium bavaricum TaxID=29290 RepID=A0A0F3GU49_9BACT|nr:hypothetical protein MBAV_002464 [Candidatus Magnetobacterium bavaricum]
MFLTQLIFVFTKIHDSAYGGAGCRGNLHEVKALLHCRSYSITYVYDAKLLALYVD